MILRTGVATILLCAWAQLSAQYVLNNFAGGGAPQGLPAANVGIGYPNFITKDAAGSLYSGGVGFLYIHTTKLTNGVHTIGWLVYDNQNRGEGIGSRFFSVQNSGP